MAGRLKVVAVTVSLSGAVFLAESAGTVADASSAQVQRVEHIIGSAARAYLEGKSRTVPGLLAAYAKSDAELGRWVSRKRTPSS